MTVGELIELLQAEPAEADVWLEDTCCACSNPAADVMYVTDRDPYSPLAHPHPPFVVITGDAP